MSCDVTWLTDFPSNPLAVGQIVNNHTRGIYTVYTSITPVSDALFW